MPSVLITSYRPLPPGDPVGPTHPAPAHDHSLDDICRLLSTARRLRIICNRHPTHFRDLRERIEALTGRLDRVARVPQGRRLKASTIERLELRMTLLSRRCEQRRRLVDGWASTAARCRTGSGAVFSFARPPGARSPAPG